MTREEAIRHFEAQAQCNYAPTCEAAQMAVAALRAQQEAEKNDPLTLEELLELEGDTVYAVCIGSPGMSCWGFIDDITNDFPGVFTGYRVDFFVEDYGDGWLAYRHKPKEETT